MILLPLLASSGRGGSPALLPFLALLHVAASRLVSPSLRFATPALVELVRIDRAEIDTAAADGDTVTNLPGDMVAGTNTQLVQNGQYIWRNGPG